MERPMLEPKDSCSEGAEKEGVGLTVEVVTLP